MSDTPAPRERVECCCMKVEGRHFWTCPACPEHGYHTKHHCDR